jgi:hypothetical protein
MVDFTLVGVVSTMAVEVFQLEGALVMGVLALPPGDALVMAAVEEGQALLADAVIKVMAMLPLVGIMHKVNPGGLSAWVAMQVLEMIGVAAREFITQIFTTILELVMGILSRDGSFRIIVEEEVVFSNVIVVLEMVQRPEVL